MKKKQSKLTGNYQGFWLIVTLRLQENVNRCICRLIRNMLIEVAQKFYGQKIVILLVTFDWFQSFEKCIPIEWPLRTLCDLSFCGSATQVAEISLQKQWLSKRNGNKQNNDDEKKHSLKMKLDIAQTDRPTDIHADKHRHSHTLIDACIHAQANIHMRGKNENK